MKSQVENPLVSVIITTKNEEDYLAFCLESLKKQSYGKVEIIVVDNGSSDKTVSIAITMGVKVYQKGPERSAQRNFGAKISKGEILIFLDADMELEKDVVKECVEEMSDMEIMALIIPERSVGQGFWSQCKAFEREFYLGVNWIEAARCYREKAFVSVGGYDENLTGPEDYDFDQRVRRKFGEKAFSRCRAMIIHNEGKIIFREQLAKKFKYGFQMCRYVSKIENTDFGNKQMNIAGRFRLFFADFRKPLSRPLLMLGVIILKLGEFIALGLGAVWGKINQSE
jgi:glycosyltransferase involved in cell wall biosynthesis